MIRRNIGRPTSLAVASVLVALLLALPGPARAYPWPGTWADIAPPDPVGGTAQAGLQIGAPHAHDLSACPALAGGSLDLRLAPWVFLSGAVGGSIPFPPAANLGPTFVLGGSGPLGVRLVLAPRVGLDVQTGDPGIHAGGHLLLDLPLGPRGGARGWIGTKYAHARDDSLRVHSDTLFLLGGWSVHATERLDLGLQVAGSVLFRTNFEGYGYAGIHTLTFTFQLRAHMGRLDDRRVSVAVSDGG